VLQHAAGLARSSWVERLLILLDVPHDSLLIDNESGAVREPMFFIEDPVLLRDCALKITEQRESESILLREHLIGGRAVNADAQHLCARVLEFGDISLIRLELFRSASGKGQNIECEHHVLLAAEIAQCHLITVLIR